MHHLLYNSPSADSSATRLHANILLNKYKLARQYTIDLLSNYHVNSLGLHIETGQKHYKMLVVVRWYAKDGTEKGQNEWFFDYEKCSKFVAKGPRRMTLLELDI